MSRLIGLGSRGLEGHDGASLGQEIPFRCSPHLFGGDPLILPWKGQTVPPRAEEDLIVAERVSATSVGGQLAKLMGPEVVNRLQALAVGDSTRSDLLKLLVQRSSDGLWVRARMKLEVEHQNTGVDPPHPVH